MEILTNINIIVSIIASTLSIIMFFKAKKEKDKCIEIKNTIEQSIQITNKNSEIKSKDEFNIEKVKHFDNRKTIS